MKPSRFVSTRGGAPAATAFEAAVHGLARDGGLYMPQIWPRIEPADQRATSYSEMVASIAEPFVDELIAPERLRQVAERAYRGFPETDPIPFRSLGNGITLAELFHGPTCAFKDFALQFLGSLYEELTRESSQTLLVIGATTGDTGPAAISAMQGRTGVAVVMLHPHNRISEIQRRQMTCVDAPNVLNIAVEGNFDDCQAIVKRLLKESDPGDGPRRTTPNSINIFRIIAQSAYYFWISRKFQRPVTFVVPSGNFGNAFSGYAARVMGATVKRLIIATNRNDVLYRALVEGLYKPRQVHATISPAMDISVASNFERLVFSLTNGDAGAVKHAFTRLEQDGAFDIPTRVLDKMRRHFLPVRVDEEETRGAMRQAFIRQQIIVDPHTAIGCRAAETHRHDIDGDIVVLATAHPAKFLPDVEAILNARPQIPPAIAALEGKKEQYVVAEASFSAVEALISDWDRPWQ